MRGEACYALARQVILFSLDSVYCGACRSVDGRYLLFISAILLVAGSRQSLVMARKSMESTFIDRSERNLFIYLEKLTIYADLKGVATKNHPLHPNCTLIARQITAAF